MRDQQSDNSFFQEWAAKALEHASKITLASPGRGSATESEMKAASYVHEYLSRIGTGNLRIQEFNGLRSIWFFLALTFGFALLGHAAFWLLRIPLGILPALFISIVAFAFSGFMLFSKFTFRDFPFRNTLPHGKSRNVVAVLPAHKETRQKVVLISHLDSHRAVIWFASDLLVKAYRLLSTLAIYGVLLAPLVYLLVVITGFIPLIWIGALLALVHLSAWFTGMTADLGLYSPGANDNAAAVGTVMALGERILAQPLQHTEVWLAFTGCEETGCDGMKVFLDAHQKELSQALFLDFELIGIGDQLSYVRSEGVVRKKSISPEAEQLIQEAGSELAIHPLDGIGAGVFTEIGVVWERGLQGACLVAHRDGSDMLPEWHRLTDTPDRLEPEALGRVHAAAWNLLQKVDETAIKTGVV
ncbi:MAG: M28 family metallopeptidase [Anaerolineales bacterium]